MRNWVLILLFILLSPLLALGILLQLGWMVIRAGWIFGESLTAWMVK